jgi:hypothetical protein
LARRGDRFDESLVKSEKVSLEATSQRKGQRARDIREVR